MSSPKMTPGQEFPPYSLVDIEGKPAGNADLHDRYTLINFFFSECAPCIHEFPGLNEYTESSSDVNLLAVTFDSADDTRALLKRHPLIWRILPDARPLIDALGIRGYPTFALVDPAGKMVAIVDSGVISGDESVVTAARLAAWVDAEIASAGRHPSGD